MGAGRGRRRTVPYRWLAPLAVLLAIHLLAVSPRAQTPSASKGPAATAKVAGSDVEMVERLIVLRRDYQKTLEQLRQVYIRAGDLERSHLVEEELLGFHRTPKHALILDLDVPPPTLTGNLNVPEANALLLEARKWKTKGGWNTEYYDNQRRAELLLQELIGKYPHSDKISDAAFELGEVYEGKAYKQYRRAARYYERCFQWNPKTQHDARLRAARLYDVQIKDRSRAIELYREITTHEGDPKRHAEATKRLQELMGPAR
jgi:tetratricopeptide (TPR) repeat protein